LQSYLFLGYPAVLNAIALWLRLSGRPPPPPVEDDWEAWVLRGGEVCRRVYGGQYGGLRENVRALHPDLERWMVAEGYGKVLGRPGLDLVDRELCIVAMLAVQDAPRQVYSHLRGALNAGATEADIKGVLAEARVFADGHALESARDSWRRVRERQRSGGCDSGSGPGYGDSARA
jgi:4-carboxymuconolactone decarboxylase